MTHALSIQTPPKSLLSVVAAVALSTCAPLTVDDMAENANPLVASSTWASVRVVRDEFSRVDGSLSGIRDGLVSTAELEQVAATSDSVDLQQAARVLLNDSETLSLLDSFGPSRQADDLIGRGAFNTYLKIPEWRPKSPDRKPVFELNIDGATVIVLVQHQIARANRGDAPDDASRAFRNAEAAYAHRVANTLRMQRPERPVIVVGDMNDEPENESVKQWVNDGTFRSVLERVPFEQRWTVLYTPTRDVVLRRQFDHILVTPDLFPSAHGVWVRHEANHPGPSDHSAVEASFNL